MRGTISAAAAVAILGFGGAGAAQAATTVYDFSGVCRDCASVGTGTLTLTNAPTGAISTTDFVSFAYKSNLVSFTLNSSDIVAMLGSFDPSRPDATVIDIVQLGGTGWEFERNADGSWSVSSELGASLRGGPGFSGGGGSGGSSGFSGGLNNPGPGFTRTVDDFGPTSTIEEDLAAAAVVPEPAAWALMLVGFGGLGVALRTRRRPLPAA